MVVIIKEILIKVKNGGKENLFGGTVKFIKDNFIKVRNMELECGEVVIQIIV
jgi:hypothetical protein